MYFFLSKESMPWYSSISNVAMSLQLRHEPAGCHASQNKGITPPGSLVAKARASKSFQLPGGQRPVPAHFSSLAQGAVFFLTPPQGSA